MEPCRGPFLELIALSGFFGMLIGYLICSAVNARDFHQVKKTYDKEKDAKIALKLKEIEDELNLN